MDFKFGGEPLHPGRRLLGAGASEGWPPPFTPNPQSAFAEGVANAPRTTVD